MWRASCPLVKNMTPTRWWPRCTSARCRRLCMSRDKWVNEGGFSKWDGIANGAGKQLSQHSETPNMSRRMKYRLDLSIHLIVVVMDRATDKRERALWEDAPSASASEVRVAKVYSLRCIASRGKRLWRNGRGARWDSFEGWGRDSERRGAHVLVASFSSEPLTCSYKNNLPQIMGEGVAPQLPR